MKETITQKVEIEVMPEVDVVVAGGGTAGVVAALAVARGGANVILIERYGYLGGMITAGNAGLTMYTKYSGNSEEHRKDEKALTTNPEDLQIVGGIVREITERLLESGMGKGNSGTFGSYVFTSSEDFKRLLFQMMKEANVKLRLHSWVVDVVQEDNSIKGVIVESKSGRQLISAKQFIDATGDGDLAAKAGVPFTVGVTKDDICAKKAKIGEMSPVGVMFKVGNSDLHKTLAWLEKNPERFKEHPFARFSFETVKRNFKNGDTATMCIRHEGKNPDDWFQVYNLPMKGVVTLCCPCIKDIDGCNVDELTRAEIIMADMVKRWMEKISYTIPGFKNIFLLDCPQIGVRETRHIQGEYVLNLMDIYEQKNLEDSIGLGSHPIDTYPRPEWLNEPETAYPSRWYFKIPYRCLIAKGKENLLIAGRCISATHEAFGCIRPTVQCMITGEAAGTAAALCIKENVTPGTLDSRLLLKTLKDRGVLL
ncbi:MAG: FAD-dependent oxidoreductase [Victivallaceae bacterium]|nr:FAD-dependent oxidoreductase [Victivallaceae bacterium]